MDFWVSKGTLTWQIIQDAVKFEDKNMMMTWLKTIFRTTDNIFFHTCCDLPADPLMSDRDQVSATAHEIWQVTSYCFR